MNSPRAEMAPHALHGQKIIRIDGDYIRRDEIIAVTAGQELDPYGELIETCSVILRGGNGLEFNVPAREVTAALGWTVLALEDA